MVGTGVFLGVPVEGVSGGMGDDGRDGKLSTLACGAILVSA